MNNLELISALYKPYRITRRGSVSIIESMDGKFVVKPKSQTVGKELFDYLSLRGFHAYAPIVDDSRSEMTIFEYIEDARYPKDQRAIDMIDTLADLHNKTSYNKEVREDKYKEIYDTLKGNLAYYKEKYENMVAAIEEEIFMSPSHYLFIRNSSKLFSQIAFCEAKTDEWYDMVKDKRETRVCLVHNKLELDHFLSGDKRALISWDAASTDSPVLDFYNFYSKECLELEFASILKEYLRKVELSEDERSLLFILLCLPKDIEFEEDEFASCDTVSSAYDYIYRTEYLVRPYYSPDDEE